MRATPLLLYPHARPPRPFARAGAGAYVPAAMLRHADQSERTDRATAIGRSGHSYRCLKELIRAYILIIQPIIMLFGESKAHLRDLSRTAIISFITRPQNV
jgi:hypothetical protein